MALIVGFMGRQDTFPQKTVCALPFPKSLLIMKSLRPSNQRESLQNSLGSSTLSTHSPSLKNKQPPETGVSEFSKALAFIKGNVKVNMT